LTKRWRADAAVLRSPSTPDNSVTVQDDGVGIPVALHPTEKVSALELVHTTLHAGGKFDNDAYKVSGGLHGVGAAAVNALSEWMEVTVRREGAVWYQRYQRGVPMTPRCGWQDGRRMEETGTTTTFKFDETIFDRSNLRV
jgi:DNA gyrase subunit B